MAMGATPHPPSRRRRPVPLLHRRGVRVPGSVACWVDLYWGILVCDVLSSAPEQLMFVPLPEDYQSHSFPMVRGRPNVYSTMGCVVGQIRLLYMDGYDDSMCPKDQVTINTWTLLGFPAQARWVMDDNLKLRCGDLWEDESFLAVPGLPKRPPMCPVLSPKYPNEVYFFSSDIGYVDGHVPAKGEHLLVLDMRSKKIQSWSKCPSGRSRELFPSFITAEFGGWASKKRRSDKV
ncbi:hypothetical protein ACP4OV_015391 [Aristida adscensionis]